MNLKRIFPLISVSFLIATIYTTVLTQVPFRIGDLVEAQRGSQWYEGRVESIQGNIVKVRFGSGKYDFQNYDGWAQIKSPGTAAQEAKNLQMWTSFSQDASKYQQSVTKFAPYFDANLLGGGLNGSPEDWQKVMNDLTELDTLCRTKYAGIQNQSGYVRDGDINNRWATR
jgi:hypothetical protein